MFLTKIEKIINIIYIAKIWLLQNMKPNNLEKILKKIFTRKINLKGIYSNEKNKHHFMAEL